MVDRAVVSTDDDEIAAAAEAAGIAAPFRRPAELSGDRIGDLPVLAHALTATEELDRRKYDIVVMLQPTSPLRTAGQVMATIELLVAGSLDSVWTVSPSELRFHPLKQLQLDLDGTLRYFDPRGADVIARQDLTPVYHRNGVSYAFTRECILDRAKMLTARSGAVVIDEPLANIDTLEDFARAESLLRDRGARPGSTG